MYPPISEEHKLKISKALKGRKVSDDTKLKLSLQKIGKKRKPYTEEHKQKLSDSLKGRVLPPMKDETKQKLSIIRTKVIPTMSLDENGIEQVVIPKVFRKILSEWHRYCKQLYFQQWHMKKLQG